MSEQLDLLKLVAARLEAALHGERIYGDELLCRAANDARHRRAIHMEQALKIDFIVRKDEPFRLEELSRRRLVSLGGVDVWSATPEDLILSKLVWSRESESELQLRDVRNLLSSATLDWQYLDRWAASLSVADLLAKARS